MSRAFLKNESADDPVVIPARAPLPPGVPNYVTPRGLALLHTELEELEAERGHVQTGEPDETERTRRLAELNGRIGALNQRIATASVVQGHDHAQDPLIRFGATVTLQSRPAKPGVADRKLTLVGVDEANAAQSRIAFTAPIARQMLGKRVGDQIPLRTPQGETSMEITAIAYSD
ncbi:GreA/GreB family elongation factor [Spirosoma areae]